MGFPCGSAGKESACNVGVPVLIPGSERSPEEGNGNPLLYSCLENSMDKGAWQAIVYRVTKSCYLGANEQITSGDAPNPIPSPAPSAPLGHPVT